VGEGRCYACEADLKGEIIQSIKKYFVIKVQDSYQFISFIKN